VPSDQHQVTRKFSFLAWTKCLDSYIKEKKVWSTRVNQRKEIKMYLQRLAIGVVTAALVSGSAVAQSTGAKKPLAKMTCEDFIGFEESFRPKVVYWAVAYGQGGKPESAGVHVAGIEQMIPVLIEGCKKAPKESFWEKVKAEVKKLEKKL
jgi:acid stress chaperone HdeA